MTLTDDLNFEKADGDLSQRGRPHENTCAMRHVLALKSCVRCWGGAQSTTCLELYTPYRTTLKTAASHRHHAQSSKLSACSKMTACSTTTPPLPLRLLTSPVAFAGLSLRAGSTSHGNRQNEKCGV
eukprot:scaffold38389_cov70-Phaeocystis_antarctica.AAC.7